MSNNMMDEMEKVLDKHGVVDFSFVARFVDGTDVSSIIVGFEEPSQANRERYLAMQGLMFEQLMDFYINSRKLRGKDIV